MTPTSSSTKNWSSRAVATISVIAAVVAILAFLGITRLGDIIPGPERAIIGTWKFDKPPSGAFYDEKSIIFTSEKTVILTLFYGNRTGNYEFLTPNRLSMNFGSDAVWVVDIKRLPDGRLQWDNYPPEGNGETYTRLLVRQE